MIMVGHRGPILAEDANDLAAIAQATKRIPPAAKWVDELREEAEYKAMMEF